SAYFFEKSSVQTACFFPSLAGGARAPLCGGRPARVLRCRPARRVQCCRTPPMENLPHKSEADACGPGPLAPTFGQQGDATPDGRERPDDETLVQRFQSGQITLEALCNHLRARYAERLLRYAECPSGGGVKRAADEAVHDTFQAFLLLAPYFKVKGGGCVG